MKYFATITLIGKDKSGVIAAITQYLFGRKANIESLEEQVRRGRFSMTLQASWVTDNFPRQEIHDDLKKLAAKLRMELKVHFARKGQKQRMALFVTGEAHAPEAVLAAVKQKKINAELAVIIGSRGDLKPLADRCRVPFHLVDFKDRAASETKALAILEKENIDFIVLARFMKILSPDFVWRWKNKIINIHPSLLPAFPGASAYRQAYEKGVKVVGVTAHFATPDLDQGPIIWQEAFTVKSGETLASIVERGRKAESKCLVKAVCLFLKNRLDVHWGRVFGV